MNNFENMFPPEPLSFTDAYNKRAKEKYQKTKNDIINSRIGIVALMTNYLQQISVVYKNEKIMIKWASFINGEDSIKVKSKHMVNMCNDLDSFTVLCTIFLDIITTYDKDIEMDDMMIKEE